MTPADLVVGRLGARDCRPRQSRPGQWTARCPNTAAHSRGDRNPSLSVAVGDDGRALVHCATGCAIEAVVAALGLDVVDLFPDRTEEAAGRRIVATYDYYDADGELVMQAVRYDPKGFAQRQPDGFGGWVWHLRGLDERPLYRLPQVLDAVANGRTVWVAEGEKDVDALVRAGLDATCNPMGAGKWRPEHTQWLAGAVAVEVVADNDEAGHTHARAVAEALAPHVATVRLWCPPAPCKDIAEHLGQGRRITDLEPLDEATPAPAAAPAASILIDWAEFWRRDHASEEWLAWPLLPAGRQVALYAPAKTGKSIVTLAVTAALATGRPILGADPAPPVDVLYLDYEMTESDLYERLDALGYGPSVDMSRLHYASLPSLPPLNTDLGAQAVRQLALDVHARCVIVDTTGRAVDGDENDSGPYRDFARHTGLTLKAAGIALLRTDHAGKDRAKGQRGSSAKNDDVDVVLRLDLADNGYTLTRTHSRVGWVPERVAIERTEDVDGFVVFRAARGVTMWPAGTAELASVMDAMGVPLNASRDRARAMGIKGRHKVVLAALKYRRDRLGVDVDGF